LKPNEQFPINRDLQVELIKSHVSYLQEYIVILLGKTSRK